MNLGISPCQVVKLMAVLIYRHTADLGKWVKIKVWGSGLFRHQILEYIWMRCRLSRRIRLQSFIQYVTCLIIPTCSRCDEFGWDRSIINSMIGWDWLWLDVLFLPSVPRVWEMRSDDWPKKKTAAKSRSSAPLIALYTYDGAASNHRVYSFHGDYSLLPLSTHPRKE